MELRYHKSFSVIRPVDEVKAGFEILKSLGIRSRGVNIISVHHAQFFAPIERKRREKKLSHKTILSIIGCVVNGPVKLLKLKYLTGGGQDSNLYTSQVPHSKVPSSEIIEKIVKWLKKNKD